MTKAQREARIRRKEAVHVAASTLDKKVPGWYRKMKPEKLNMPNTSLCALGQLFGSDVELSIAKELFPEEWRKCRKSAVSGFSIGLQFVGSWFRKGEITDKEFIFMHSACGANADLKCYWAEEVANRLIKEESGAEACKEEVGADPTV